MMAFLRAFLLPLIIILVLVDLFSQQRILTKWLKGYAFITYFLLLIFALEYYSFEVIRTLFKGKSARVFYIVAHVLLYAVFIYLVANSRGPGSTNFKYFIIVVTLVLLPKLFIAFSLVVEDLLRAITFLFQKISDTKSNNPIAGRRKVIAWLALGFASLPFIGALDGIFFGKYRYRVIKKTLEFDDLPIEFDGFTITQLSDIHSGSFDDEEKVKYGIDLANAQKSDVLVFTGDMVNNHYTELEPWVKHFQKLNAPLGMFSIFGNHDYAGYGKLSAAEKSESLNKLTALQEEIGFKLLKNQKHSITRNGKTLNIIGVENWGASHYFPKKGDLKKATQGVNDTDFNVLLSHDPSHFDHDLPEYDNIVNFSKKMHLTLSGHTHGMQFGIEIPGLIKWSPVKYRYPKWAGLYESMGKKLYVNRGFGFLAFPGRIGMWPEITVLTLKTKA